MCKRIVILGSTGSIGKRTIDVVRTLGSDWKIVGLAAGSNWKLLSEQARAILPDRVVIAQNENYSELRSSLRDLPIEVSCGTSEVEDLAGMDEADFVLCAIVGSQSISSVLRAIDAGHDIGIASKEALVLAGQQVMSRAREKGIAFLPVDSEHSAIFQSMRAGNRSEVHRIILTASGGPFRDWPAEKVRKASLKEALSHPTWSMGEKITIDSATMMNKALEIIEAHYLFEIEPDKISVLVHPESIVHSLVEFSDGSTIGQCSIPDMALPIEYALTWPERRQCVGERLDLARVGRLNFYEPDFEKFPAIRLAYQVAEKGGTAGAVFNAANEMAVDIFIQGRIIFGKITELVDKVLNKHEWKANPSLEELLEADRWARNEVIECMNRC